MLRVKECLKRVLLLVICIECAIGCNSVDDRIKVSGISSITVQRGRTVVIAANTYNFEYNTTEYENCLVYVTSTPTFSCGVLSPDVFNCSSKPDLLYTHYGCEKDTEAIDVAMSLTSSHHNAFATEHHTVEVKIISITDPILKPSDKIIVPPDTQNALLSLKLSNNSNCEYAIVSPIRLPYYGIVSGPIEQWLVCNSSQSFEYTVNQHQRHQPEDRVIVAIKSNGSISYELIPVFINNLTGRDCVLNNGGELLVTFNCYTPVGVKNLIASNCSFVRDWKLQVKKGERFSAISLLTSYSRYSNTYTFTLGQLEDGMVAYQRKLLLPKTYQYKFSVYDVYGRLIFNNTIISKSTSRAGQHVQIVTNTGIDVVEGQSAVVTAEILDLVEEDCSNFSLILVEKPAYGHFRLTRTNVILTKVNLQQLHSVVFEHSGGDNFGDFAVWEVQCSNISIGRFVQPIRVIMKDDSPPYLSKNSILTVHSDRVAQLSQFHLQAKDADSCDDTLKYTILSADGQFYNSKEDALSNNGSKVIQFRQQDINAGNIWYRPPEDIGNHDVVLFNLSDEAPTPNVLPNQKLTINILISYQCPFCEAALDPVRLSDIPVVEIAGETNLSPIHFSPFTKQFVSHDWLQFYIVDPPQFGSIIPNNFTLDFLRDNKVVYQHKGIGHNCNDSFVFKVHNITGAKVFGKIVVSIVKQNTTRSVTLRVSPFKFSILRPTLAAKSIVITDTPVCTEHLLFVVESVPESGTIYYSIRDTHLTVGSWFSLKHLTDLAYHPTNNSWGKGSIYNDSFSFSLLSPLSNLTANGQHTIHYPITYDLSDPIVTLNSPKNLDCNDNDFLCYYNLSISNINVISNVAQGSELIIVVKNGPSCGRLVFDSTEVSEFTLLQLKKKQIAYEFNATLCNIGNYTDKFGFVVKIVGHTARTVKINELHLYWSYVMVDQPKIEVNETDETFNITVRLVSANITIMRILVCSLYCLSVCVCV